MPVLLHNTRSFQHVNVGKLLGLVSHSPYYLVLELTVNGDLKTFLLEAAAALASSNHENLKRPQAAIKAPQLVAMATDVAAGLGYLESLGYVHRDVAARNCMVTQNLSVKLTGSQDCCDVHTPTQHTHTTSHNTLIPPPHNTLTLPPHNTFTLRPRNTHYVHTIHSHYLHTTQPHRLHTSHTHTQTIKSVVICSAVSMQFKPMALSCPSGGWLPRASSPTPSPRRPASGEPATSTCVQHVLHMCCACVQHMLHMCCACVWHMLHMCCTCVQHMLHMSGMCHTCVVHVSGICYTCPACVEVHVV